MTESVQRPCQSRRSSGSGRAPPVATCAWLVLNYMQVWCDRPIKGVSHPKEFLHLPPLEMLAKRKGATLVIDDVATSGYRMWEAITGLRSLGTPAAGIAWISADSGVAVCKHFPLLKADRQLLWSWRVFSG
jgi:hypothetical protein